MLTPPTLPLILLIFLITHLSIIGKYEIDLSSDKVLQPLDLAIMKYV